MPNVTALAQPIRQGDKQVHIFNGMQYEIDEPMLAACLAKAAQYLTQPSCSVVNIVVGERVPTIAPDWKHPGWLEYEIHVHNQKGGLFFIAAIQRNVGRKIEFHS